ncbi:hypothetical protein [Stieleria maiorica]|uniref:hypothetical protein n=1 Tax=Stieleria maiorica TaxID=2795974 RepID=UPI0011C93664|nr:hypothetical protein [Stieleria maiorica]
MATPLLVVRDPVVLVIYWLTLRSGMFPKNNLITATLFLGAVSWFFAVTLGHMDPLVASYGVRCDFFHVPLIFVMGRVLTRSDVDSICRTALWVSIPFTLLLIAQFYSPQSSFLNRGVGGDLSGAGFSGALGRFRPPGTFSFINGPASLYPMLCCAWFYLVCRRKISLLLMGLSGGAILLAIPFSISRSLFIGELVAICFGVAAIGFGGAMSFKLVFRSLLGGGVAIALFCCIPGTSEAFAAFADRWEKSTTNRGGVQEAIVGRVVEGLLQPFSNMPVIGYGSGISTIVGQKLATGTRGFGYSEGEWGRILMEGGLVLGPLVLGYRISILCVLALATCRAALRRDWCSLPFLAVSAQMILLGQWGQATSLGASIITGGFCLAASRPAGVGSRRRKSPTRNRRSARRVSRRRDQTPHFQNRAPGVQAAEATSGRN